MTPRKRLRPASVAILLVVACALAGCGRRVVVDPSRVAAENDRDWTVKSAPASAH